MRESKVHYVPDNNGRERTQCGNRGRLTYVLDAVTCRVCMFGYLAEQAPWAREFLDGLRKSAGGGQLESVGVPARLAEEMDRKVKRGGGFLGRTFRHECGSQKAISELLTQPAPAGGAVQPVMDNSGAPAEPVGIEERNIAHHPWDAGKVRDESGWDF